MSLITRCPACGTLFKVVADQLKLSQGWVRCGQCREVFDAQAYMSTPPPSQTKPELAGRSEVTLPVAVAVAVAVDVDSIPSVIPADTKAKIIHQDFASSDWINSVNPPAPKEYADSASSKPSSLLPSDLSPEELEMVGGFPLALNGEADVSKPAKLTTQTRPDTTPADLAPSFVRQAQRAQRWRSPWVRAMLSLVAVMLVITLSLQWALQERDRIAAAQPRALPWLQQLCGLARCTVGPLRQIDAVVVDASSFNKQRSEGKFELYKLGLNLKNNGPIAVALPHIELSLNDAQDMPVLRRVLNPADLGASQSVLPPAAEFAGSTTVQIDSTQLAGSRIAGYRVLAFYP